MLVSSADVKCLWQVATICVVLLGNDLPVYGELEKVMRFDASRRVLLKHSRSTYILVVQPYVKTEFVLKRSSRYRCVPKIASPEAQKSESITAQYKKHRCVPKIASPEARKKFENKKYYSAIEKNIVVYLKSPRRRRKKILKKKKYYSAI